jgi:hypothetical protein
MSSEIIGTDEIDERDLEDNTDMVATHEPTGNGIEFHVGMRGYTMRDMETLIVEAAARMIVGKHSDNNMAKAVEARCVELITKKADTHLATVTAEIIDQPILPKYNFSKPDEKPMTMREFIGLTGRDYLSAMVDSSGKPTTDRHYGKTRMQHLVEKHMEVAFKREIEKATNAAITEVQAAIKARHAELLASETARLRDYLAKATGAA